MEEKPVEKLLIRERHLPDALPLGVASPGKGHLLAFKTHQARVGDRPSPDRRWDTPGLFGA